MRQGDRVIQLWRIRKAAPWIPPGSKVLDIGCHEGEFLRYLGARIHDSIGLDPLATETQTETFRLERRGFTRHSGFPTQAFDAIVMLATIEHMHGLREILTECARILRPGGRVVLTVPSPSVDRWLGVLRALGAVDGMSLEQHYGLEPRTLLPLFAEAASFRLLTWKKFQLGLNNLLVFTLAGNFED